MRASLAGAFNAAAALAVLVALAAWLWQPPPPAGKAPGAVAKVQDRLWDGAEDQK